MAFGSSHDRYRKQFTVNFPLSAATAIASNVWVATRPCKLIGVKEIHSVVGGTSAAIRPRKITDTSAPGASAGATVIELTSAAIDLTATVNVTQTPTLVTTGSVPYFKVGHRLCHSTAGTLTGLAGGVVEYTFEAL